MTSAALAEELTDASPDRQWRARLQGRRVAAKVTHEP